MGFRAPRTEITLTFDGYPDLDGLEVRMRSVSVAEYGRLTSGELSDEQTLAAFAGALVSWNLEDDAGEPVPATAAGVGALDSALFTRLLRAWLTGLVSVPPPLPRPSANGSNPEASIPMAPLPGNPPS